MARRRPNGRSERNIFEAESIKRNMFNYDLRDPFRDRTTSYEDSSECPICAVPNNNQHKSTLKHRFNFSLWQWKKYRKGLIKNRNGIEIMVKPMKIGSLKYFENKSSGSHTIQANPQEADIMNNKFCFHVEIKNVGKIKIHLLNLNFLYPYKCFVINDYLELLRNGSVLQLNQGAAYFFKVEVELPNATMGHFKLPIVLNFLNENNHQDFEMMRQVAVVISDDETDVTQSSKAKRDTSNFEKVKKFVPPTDGLRPTTFKIPPDCRNALTKGLNEAQATDVTELTMMKNIKLQMKNLNYPAQSNYDTFFHFVLWMDEIGEEVMTSQYNLTKIILTPVENKKLFELEVEGLAEKRPSLLKNDIVNIKECGTDNIAYQGKIVRLFDRSIHIGMLHPQFYNKLVKNPTIEVDISFQPSRITFERMHLGVQSVHNSRYLLNSLFPIKSENSIQRISLRDEDIFNKEIINNPEQKQAVENILSGTSSNYPYIVYGPPGTGKTVTIVEAILQIKFKVVNCNILVCAPANAACNMLTSKLIPWCKKDELIRVHSSSNPWDGVPADVKKYSNWKDDDYVTVYGEELQKYRIVITTLALSGRYLQKKYAPQYVFIDEAAQAMEPEATIAISLLARKFQLVLAGDPKQLGPIVVSKAAKEHFLGVSLLERLMSTGVYADNNPDYITMLRLNFRAHPEVLYLPNKIFYNTQLKTMSVKALEDPIASVCIYHQMYPQTRKDKLKNGPCLAATEFYSIFSEETRERGSPSYFNAEEVNMVVKTVIALCKLTQPPVSQGDIGIITPYISQVHKIKMRLKDKYPQIEVGSTETFQGREKRIIIISTVRAQKSLLLYDAKYKLGFVKNPQRFNVALTRAMSKIIVIGCPNVLRYDQEFWLQYMDYCVSRNSYFGAPFDRRTDETMEEVVHRYKQIKTINRR